MLGLSSQFRKARPAFISQADSCDVLVVTVGLWVEEDGETQLGSAVMGQ